MARAKRASDEQYNARRRAKRLAARLERQGKTIDAQALRDLVAGSYKGGTVISGELDTAYNAYRTSKRTAKASAPKPAKVVSTPTPKQKKPPRPHRPSDDLRNARRRLERQANRLERDSKGQPEMIRKQMESLAKSLREHVQSAYGVKPEKVSETLDRLAKVREYTIGASYGKSAVYRRNTIIMQQLNAAGTEGADSSISERKKDVFWAAVKGLWPEGSDVPRNERYNKIIDHFYFSDHSDAKKFEQWLNKKGLEKADVGGDLSLIYEYITEELNDPAEYDDPELPYQEVMKLIHLLK